MPKVEINSVTCKACELCVSNCPKDVLALGSTSNPSGYHFAVVVNQDACIACKMCAVICPDGAIEIYK
ncbi:MAG: 4Fe-4S binding protein [Clostridiales bacterium]|nr:4Fe-4S binding protein [Clostridiales bacterium]